MTNRTIIVLIALSMLLHTEAFGQDLYATITNLWWEGPKTNLISIAENRLTQDTNDIVGAVLKMECDTAFGDGSSFSNSFWRFIRTGRNVRTPAFRCWYPLESLNLAVVLESMPSLSTNEWLAEMEKGMAIHREMTMKESWNALGTDGWLQALPPPNVFSRQGVESRTPADWRQDDIWFGKMVCVYALFSASKTEEGLSSAWESFRSRSDTEVLSESQWRLTENPADLYGATEALYYHIKRCDPTILSNATDRIEVLSNAVERVVRLGALETRPPFADHWPWISVYLDNVLIWLAGTNSVPFEEALHYSDLHPDP